jgi:hypothetical protein
MSPAMRQYLADLDVQIWNFSHVSTSIRRSTMACAYRTVVGGRNSRDPHIWRALFSGLP